MDVEFVALLADQGLGDAGQGRHGRLSEKPLRLRKYSRSRFRGRRAQSAHLAGDLNQFVNLRQEPGSIRVSSYSVSTEYPRRKASATNHSRPGRACPARMA